MASKCYIFEILFVCIMLQVLQTVTSSQVLCSIKLPEDNQEIQYFTKEAIKLIPAFRRSQREIIVLQIFDPSLYITSDERRYEFYVIYKRTMCDKGQLKDSCLNLNYWYGKQYCKIKVYTKAAEPITAECSHRMNVYFYIKIFGHPKN